MPRITYIKPKDEMIMYCDKPIIILPEKNSVLRDVKNQSIYTDFEQYSIYYKNIIFNIFLQNYCISFIIVLKSFYNICLRAKY